MAIPAQHRERLGGCDPRLIKLVGAVINDLEKSAASLMFPMVVLANKRGNMAMTR